MTSATLIGDTTFLADYLINTKLYAVVMPPNPDGSAPDQEFVATFEVQGDQGTLTMAAIIGPRGLPGIDMFILYLQTDNLDDPVDLPQPPVMTATDKGKFWVFDDVDGQGNVIGSSGYIWYGDSYKRIMLGTPGPPGPIPIITPSVELVPNGQGSQVIPGGTALYPTQHFELDVPPGPVGPGAAIAISPDVDLSGGVNAGDVLGFTGRYTTGLFLPAPSPVGVAVSSSGGTLPAGDWFWVVTSTNAAGETTPSNEVSATTTGTTSAADLTWPVVPLATNYKIYRGGTAGGENVLVATIAGTATGYTDTGAAGTAATPPASNTAATNYPIWVPVSISQLIPSPYSMPENAFSSFSGISQRAAIGSFALPAQPFPWTPIVWGHIGAFGIELSANPLQIGCEVLLGDPTTGQQIGRGFGNTLGEVNIMPHYSTPSTPSQAITPKNGIAAIPANHTNVAQGTIYVNLYNDGSEGIYSFNPTDSQVFVQVIPVSPTSMTAAAVSVTRRLPARSGRNRR